MLLVHHHLMELPHCNLICKDSLVTYNCLASKVSKKSVTAIFYPQNHGILNSLYSCTMVVLNSGRLKSFKILAPQNSAWKADYLSWVNSSAVSSSSQMPCLGMDRVPRDYYYFSAFSLTCNLFLCITSLS